MSAPHRVGIVVFDGAKSLDASGPMEAFDEANREGASYELLVLSPGGRMIRASNGLRIGADAALSDDVRLDTVIVAGADHLPLLPADAEIVDGVRSAAARASRVASVCTGAFLLGAAGLLDGRRATTHWRHVHRLQASFPTARVEADALFVRDGSIHTSAGVTAGIDLTLALVEADHGGEVARRVARSLVVFLQRPGGQSQFSPALSTPRPSTPSLRVLFDDIAADPTADLSTTALAARVAMSPRHFTRLFGEETGMAPHRYVELVRVQAACAALDRGASVTAAVEYAGFPSVDALRRAFRDRLAVTPASTRSASRPAAARSPHVRDVGHRVRFHVAYVGPHGQAPCAPAPALPTEAKEAVMTSSPVAARGLGTAGAVALYVTAVVGPGILTLPAAAAQTAGPLSLLALAALLAISVPAAFAFVHIHRATAASNPSGRAGIQHYVTAAFGPRAGRIAAAWFYFGVPIGVPALALIGGAYVSAAVGGGRTTQLIVAWVIAGIAILANVRIRRSGGVLSLVLAVALVMLIVGTAVVSAPNWHPRNLQDFAPNGVLAVVPASLTLMWVLTGWEASTNFVGMVRDPNRRLPRVIGITLVVVVLLYASVALPEILVLGPFAGSTSAPVAAVLQQAIGHPAASVAALLAAILALANSVAYLASLRELGTGFLRPRRGTEGAAGPKRALLAPAAITVAGLGLASVTDLDVSRFVEICAGSQIPVYVAALAAGLVVLRRRSRGWWIALVATAAVALLLIPAGPYLLMPLVIAVGVLVNDAVRTAREGAQRSG